MKIVGLSDIHGQLGKIEIEECDVTCICGDIMPLDIQRDIFQSHSWLINKFLPWCGSLPCERVIFIWGNHDFYGEYRGYTPSEDGREPIHMKSRAVLRDLFCGLPQDDPIMKKVVLLEDSEYEYGGIRFYGSSWCPDLKRWAFYQTSEGLKRKFRKIPSKVDVLLTHCPPKIEDYGRVLERQDGGDFGCQERADRIQVAQPRLHLFGHVHSGDHKPKVINGTELCNVSLLDESYKMTYNPQTFYIHGKL